LFNYVYKLKRIILKIIIRIKGNIMYKLLILGFLCLNGLVALGQLADGEQACQEGKMMAYSQAKQYAKKARVAFPGDARFDVNYYKLEIGLSFSFNSALPTTSNTDISAYSNRLFTGKATMKAKTTTATNQIFLDFVNAKLPTSVTDSLYVDSVYVNGAKTTNYSRTSTQVVINFATQLSANELFSTTVYYHGLPKSTGFGTFNWGNHPSGSTLPKAPAIWSLSEPYGAPDWWPGKDNPADKADSSDVWITVPNGLIGVSNGILEQTITEATSTTYKWKSRNPIAPYLISIAVSNYTPIYTTFTKGAVTFPIDHYLYPENNTPAVITQLAETNFAMNLFIDKFGPYPFANERYGHAQFGWGGGMEHQTCSSMVNFGSGLIAHELAHQWFGDEITCQDWANIWLNEGFATFGALLYREAKIDTASYRAGILSTMASAKNAVGTVNVQDINNISQIFSGSRSYNKGGIVLHMLRNILGDTKFYDALKAYTASIHSYGNANTENFKNIVEASSGVELDYFFSEWIFGVSYPKYTWDWDPASGSGAKKNGGLNSIKLKISQTTNTDPAFFTMPIDLRVTFTDSTKIIQRVFNNSQVQTFDLTYTKQVARIEFDPNNGIMDDVTFDENLLDVALALEEEKEKKIAPLSSELYLDANNIYLYPNPTRNLVTVEFAKSPKNIAYTIYNTSGKVVISQNQDITNGKLQVSLASQPTGLYFLKLQAGNSQLVRKVLKTN
jgi:aminopeptidase N